MVRHKERQRVDGKDEGTIDEVGELQRRLSFKLQAIHQSIEDNNE